MPKPNAQIEFRCCYANDPVGWTKLKETIEKTTFSNINQLQDRTFELIITGATYQYEFALEPKLAFKLERTGPDKIQVTIVNPQALVKTDLIVQYHPLIWQITRKDPFKPKIQGEASCMYTVVFSQTGVGEIDLSMFVNDYDVSYELSNPEAVSSVTQKGKGYDIMRVPNSAVETKMRLRIKKKSGDTDLQTDWIIIPSCKITQTAQTPTITTISTPTIQAVDPAELLDVEIDGMTFCEEVSGKFCSTLKVTATNRGQNTIRCSKIFFYMKYGDEVAAIENTWVELNAGANHTFYITLKALNKPDVSKWTYKIKKTECFFK